MGRTEFLTWKRLRCEPGLEWHGYKVSTRAKWRSCPSACGRVLDKRLTPPTLSERRFIVSVWPGYNFRVTKERWTQIGITIEFLIIIRTLCEFFLLRHIHGMNFSTVVAAPYVGGALISACFCWVGVIFYFLRHYMLSTWLTLGSIPILLVYKFAVIGW